MKLLMSIFLVSFISLVEGQKKRDTLEQMKMPDCTEFHHEEKQLYDELIKDWKEVDYSTLNRTIINGINKSSFKTNNLKIYLRSIRTICGNEIDYSLCYSNVNRLNPLYSEGNFWNEESVKAISLKLDKNLIFMIKYFGFGNNEVFVDKTDNTKGYVRKEAKNFITTLKKRKYKKRNFYYLPNAEHTKVNIDDADILNLQFRNYLDRIVVVKYNINNKAEYKTFQYNDKEWKEILTKDEFKF
ncbi:hypothetical protein [Chryseobacterium polytrichastri]|uniref:Uncharacterized protein n=1 Tax=Chryseobacterium polytrichastri TaxID=1302687 RepID=A0A1M7ETI8_9FLAO|nr:hypothetical protein [Chryseobacterium polytrichastri]SHL94943.1 hypothetical protein SAMN05444267_102926 [Chryseobacterium polytrichastri]